MAQTESHVDDAGKIKDEAPVKMEDDVGNTCSPFKSYISVDGGAPPSSEVLTEITVEHIFFISLLIFSFSILTTSPPLEHTVTLDVGPVLCSPHPQ